MRRGFRSGQTRTEALVALTLFAIAIGGAWLLYRDQIMHTLRRMADWFGGA